MSDDKPSDDATARIAKEAAKPLFLTDQFKVVMKNMNGEPILPSEDGFGDPDHP